MSERADALARPKQKILPIYLGIDGPEAQQLADQFDAVAERLGLNRSELVKQIAEGNLHVVETPDLCAAPFALDPHCDVLLCELRQGHSGRHQASVSTALVTWE